MENRTEALLERFQELNNIPRGSGNIDPPFQYLTTWAKENNFPYDTDETQNIVIKVPASAGYEKSPTVIIQGHMDMVCEKIDGSTHDFMKDPIENYVDGDWLRARETSLGADNGIALAIAFDLIKNPEVKHPPMEILITTEEEVGMDGAHGLKGDFLKGRILINLDSEEEGIFTIGCAGGCDTFYTFPKHDTPAEDLRFVKIRVDGLQGGHSGTDIHKGRASAMEITGRLIEDLARRHKGRVAHLHSGSGATNAIARSADLTIALPRDSDLTTWQKEWSYILEQENKVVDKEIKLTLSDCDPLPKATSLEESLHLGEFMMSLPQGVFGMSREIEGLVETSSNIAGVHTTERGYSFFGSQRSSITSRLSWMRERITSLADLAGCVDIRVKNKYPTWQPDSSSPLLKRCVNLYKEMFHKEAEVEAIHAGLEPGLIGSKYSDMDMISMGPTLTNPHSPDEALLIPTLQPVYEFLAKLLEGLK